MKRNFTRRRVEGVTVTQRIHDDSTSSNSGTYRARARSKRHADRLARRLGWYSYAGGVGRPWGEVYFDGRYLVYRYGMDT